MLRSSQRGSHQARRPRRVISAGISVSGAAAGDVGDDRQLAVDADTEAVRDEVVRLA